MPGEIIEHIFQAFKKSRIAIIGDLMIDKYIFGHVSRISPEYPVPVVDVNREDSRLGGAANVAINTHALGAETLLFGVTGQDAERTNLLRLMQERQLDTSMVVADPSRPTTCKTRILSQNHHITRVDYERRHPLDEAIEAQLLGMFRQVAPSLDAVVLEDYNKGVLAPSLVEAVIAVCRDLEVPVLVDPKLKGFFSYSGCTVFKPNLSELSASLGISAGNTDREVEEACLQLTEKLDVTSLVVTRSEKGMTIYNGSFTHIPAVSLDVADVSGAGDTVIAMLALGMASKLDLVTSTRIANLAAHTVCQEVGAVPVRTEKLFNACLAHLRETLKT
ncbi:MAG TPA: D-glycero-beta-D-manno-heptose-7-phosphate kinase [Chlorobaculum parvum]|uniref:D-glycero-beta-D-manno-heptose-7-phosphate kinase n=1 Tax=Chlorobaculum parvum TaxID=274539 RepID=A0A7C5HH66_9CHLB|nr:D-glycero-beta-D-manno-heptose-7-phosphate kinase [Chlorobaculum parvum]